MANDSHMDEVAEYLNKTLGPVPFILVYDASTFDDIERGCGDLVIVSGQYTSMISQLGLIEYADATLKSWLTDEDDNE